MKSQLKTAVTMKRHFQENFGINTINKELRSQIKQNIEVGAISFNRNKEFKLFSFRNKDYNNSISKQIINIKLQRNIQ